MSQEALDHWLEQHAERVTAKQRSQVDTSKLLVSITLAVAATMVATALQVDPVKWSDYVACAVLALSFGASVTVVMLDVVKEPNRHLARDHANAGKWSPEAELLILRKMALDSEVETRRGIRIVQRVTELQVLLSATASLFAAVSLLF